MSVQVGTQKQRYPREGGFEDREAPQSPVLGHRESQREFMMFQKSDFCSETSCWTQKPKINYIFPFSRWAY